MEGTTRRKEQIHLTSTGLLMEGTPQIPPDAKVVVISKLHIRSKRRRGTVLESFAACIAHD
jgi:hypothetical protein